MVLALFLSAGAFALLAVWVAVSRRQRDQSSTSQQPSPSPDPPGNTTDHGVEVTDETRPTLTGGPVETKPWQRPQMPQRPPMP